MKALCEVLEGSYGVNNKHCASVLYVMQSGSTQLVLRIHKTSKGLLRWIMIIVPAQPGSWCSLGKSDSKTASSSMTFGLYTLESNAPFPIGSTYLGGFQISLEQNSLVVFPLPCQEHSSREGHRRAQCNKSSSENLSLLTISRRYKCWCWSRYLAGIFPVARQPFTINAVQICKTLTVCPTLAILVLTGAIFTLSFL